MDSNKKFSKPSDKSQSSTSHPEGWGDGNADLTRKLAKGKDRLLTDSPESKDRLLTDSPESMRRPLSPIDESKPAEFPDRRKSTSDKQQLRRSTVSDSRGIADQLSRPRRLSLPDRFPVEESPWEQPIDTNPQDKVTEFYNSLRQELTKQSSYLENKEKEHFQGTIGRLPEEALRNQCKAIIESQKDIKPENLATSIIQHIRTIQEKKESGKDTRNSDT
jgi:hypothetical protein